MQITARDLAHLLSGTIEGDPSVAVQKPGKIESGQPGEICFLGNSKYEHFAYTTQASILLVSQDFQPKQPVSATLIRVENVYASLAFLLEKFGAVAAPTTAVISDKAVIDPAAVLGKNVSVGAFSIIESGAQIGDNTLIYGQVYIGKDTIIGRDSIIYPGVKIYHNCHIGAQAILHSGAVIGADGFGFAPQSDGSYKKIHHAGSVILGANVEVGANATIDRASIGATLIGEGVKIDNSVQIAHNVEIGSHTVIAAQTGVAGSTKIGKNCRIGGQVGFGGHLTIGDNVQIQGQAGVTSNIASGSKLFGTPAFDYGQFARSFIVFKQLPDMMRRLIKLEKERRAE